jgi:hypothetical protein
MKAQIKKNPTRIRIYKSGNSLMLLMEYLSKYRHSPILKITEHFSELNSYFDFELSMTAPAAQSIKKYINNNL